MAKRPFEPPKLDRLRVVQIQVPGPLDNMFGPEVAQISVPEMEGVEPAAAAKAIIQIIYRRALTRVWKTRNNVNLYSAGASFSLIFGLPAVLLIHLFYGALVPPLWSLFSLKLYGVVVAICFFVAWARSVTARNAQSSFETLYYGMPGAGRAYSAESIRLCNGISKVSVGLQGDMSDEETPRGAYEDTEQSK